ncbi:MAG: hypothetical protein C7B43_06250 [Sulfobacillus benefaciens]|uniref:Uncharacterized protein n=1 Tax=Sulfobacillus benefaciens TaxID=453960 RepID=A0A2T2X732_9FIRM|nr:MAG: hypothetical protein C7B43_06250 [Sulfobacillus benefaciens]
MNAELPDNSRRWMMSVKTIPLLKSSMAYTLANLLFLLGDSVVGTLVNFCPRGPSTNFFALLRQEITYPDESWRGNVAGLLLGPSFNAKRLGKTVCSCKVKKFSITSDALFAPSML